MRSGDTPLRLPSQRTLARMAQVRIWRGWFALSANRRADFMKLHTRDFDESGYPELAPRFVAWLDSVRRAAAGDGRQHLSADEAWLKLVHDHADLARIVRMRCHEDQTIPAMAERLDVSTRTIYRRLWRGLELLSRWSGVVVALSGGGGSDRDGGELKPGVPGQN